MPLAGATFGFPTCWDQWFPELARAYSLAGAEVLVYPTAIGSEPELPAFDTAPQWQQVIAASGIGIWRERIGVCVARINSIIGLVTFESCRHRGNFGFGAGTFAFFLHIANSAQD